MRHTSTELNYSMLGMAILIVGLWKFLSTSNEVVAASAIESFASSSSSSSSSPAPSSSDAAVSDVIASAKRLLDSSPSTSSSASSSLVEKLTFPFPAHQPEEVKPAVVKEGLENPDDNRVKITNINLTDNQSKFKLRDYYIKTAYNCFNPNNFKNDSVSIDAAKYVISRGCRCLDFEVYSVNNEPVIASSSVKSFNYKETYNHIPMSEALEVIGTYAFSNSKCPNPQDPLIIHIRFMSENITMYDNLAKVFENSKPITPRLLGPRHGRENHRRDLGDMKLSDFAGKVIIAVDSTNTTFRSTKFVEFVNMSSNTMFLAKKTFYEVRNIGDTTAFKEANKKYMCIVLPVRSGKPVNDTPVPAMDSWGCQMVAMCFQESARDDKLKMYEDKFNSIGYAFMLKPEELRYVPITISPPTPADPKNSYEKRPFSVPGGGFTL